jgi:hypothetical protein
METMRKTWTDERLDDMSHRIDDRFDDMNRRMEEGFRRVDADLRALHETIHRTLLQLSAGVIVTVAVGFAGLIATQL